MQPFDLDTRNAKPSSKPHSPRTVASQATNPRSTLPPPRYLSSKKQLSQNAVAENTNSQEKSESSEFSLGEGDDKLRKVEQLNEIAKNGVMIKTSESKDSAAIALESDGSNGSSQVHGDEPPPDIEPEQGFLPVLRNRNFLSLWSGQVFPSLPIKFIW